jgi:hypothetical protein
MGVDIWARAALVPFRDGDQPERSGYNHGGQSNSVIQVG